jgi:hypothetical protein
MRNPERPPLKLQVVLGEFWTHGKTLRGQTTQRASLLKTRIACLEHEFHLALCFNIQCMAFIIPSADAASAMPVPCSLLLRNADIRPSKDRGT